MKNSWLYYINLSPTRKSMMKIHLSKKKKGPVINKE